jgi:hypothetical protein
MRASLLARAGSIVAAGAMVTGGAMAMTGVANAAVKPKLETHLTIAARSAKEHGKKVTEITGHLGSHSVPLVGKTVYLEKRVTAPGDKWAVVGKETTRKFGKVFFVVTPKATSGFKLVFLGTPNFKASQSAVVHIKVTA